MRTVIGARYVETHYGDDLRAVALRELGDATRWVEIADLNGLRPPYILDPPAPEAEGVILAGAALLVPAAKDLPLPLRHEVYLRDCAVDGGLLQVDDSGGLAVVSGWANFKQQILHRVITPTGQLSHHPDYGCEMYRLIGVLNGPAKATLATEYLRAAVLSDFRVSSASDLRAVVEGDVLRPEGRVTSIAGGTSLDISNDGRWRPLPWSSGDSSPVGWGINWNAGYGG